MTTEMRIEGAALLSHWGVIRASGADAAQFLHSQLTQDVLALDADHARLAGLCTAKGRMLASMIVLRPATEEVLLIIGTDLLPTVLKRLAMFVLRAKVKLADASAEFALVGLTGPAADTALGAAAPTAVWLAALWSRGRVLRLPDAPAPGTLQRRFIWVGPADQLPTLSGGLPNLPLAEWQWLDVSSGLPAITPQTVEQFVPQMINFELVGGVSFRKGCYPGQEVVARSQYLGKLKRRAALFHADVEMQSGQEVFSVADPSQPAGRVVNAAPHPAGGWSALVEVKLDALGGEVRLGGMEGPALRNGSLPYELVAEGAAESATRPSVA